MTNLEKRGRLYVGSIEGSIRGPGMICIGLGFLREIYKDLKSLQMDDLIIK